MNHLIVCLETRVQLVCDICLVSCSAIWSLYVHEPRILLSWNRFRNPSKIYSLASCEKMDIQQNDRVHSSIFKVFQSISSCNKTVKYYNMKENLQKKSFKIKINDVCQFVIFEAKPTNVSRFYQSVIDSYV